MSKDAQRQLPDRLAKFERLQGRSVYAVDGSYRHESAHFRRRTVAEGGEGSSKGHCLLSFFDVRLGAVLDAQIETRSRHEIPVLKDYDAGAGALTRTVGALWVVDRAFIDATFWDAKKAELKATMVTRLREDLSIDSNEVLPLSPRACNKGVISDERITLASSKAYWQLVTTAVIEIGW